MTGEELWAEVAERLRGKVGDPSYKLWLRELVVLGYDGATIEIGVCNAVYRDWLMRRFGTTILDAVEETEHDVRVDLVLLPEVKLPPISYEPAVELRRDRTK